MASSGLASAYIYTGAHGWYNGFPLTTRFTPSSSCFGQNKIWKALSVFIYTDAGSTPVFTITSSAWHFLGPIEAFGNGCYPTHFDTSSTYYFSPGVCPQSYTPGLQVIENDDPTTHICCPTAYDFSVDCTTFGWLSGLNCKTYISYEAFVTFIVTTIGEDHTSESLGTISNLPVAAYGIPVVFQSGDFPTAASSQLTGGTAAPASSSTPPPGPTSGSDSELSTSAKVGIGVGVSIGCIINVSLLFLAYFVRRRKADRENTLIPMIISDFVGPRTDVVKYEMAGFGHQYEVPGLQIPYEVQVVEDPQEMDVTARDHGAREPGELA